MLFTYHIIVINYYYNNTYNITQYKLEGLLEDKTNFKTPNAAIEY